jgi:hypothetical protein
LRNHACQKGSTGLFAKRVACTRRDIAEIVANVAVNIFTNYFNHVARTDVDQHVIAVLNASDPNLPKMTTAGTSPTTEIGDSVNFRLADSSLEAQGRQWAFLFIRADSFTDIRSSSIV